MGLSLWLETRTSPDFAPYLQIATAMYVSAALKPLQLLLRVGATNRVVAGGVPFLATGNYLSVGLVMIFNYDQGTGGNTFGMS